ncbi:MAG: hypothetical protein ACI9MC_003350 [Kiritimatiellia bacterium]|jgi:hypothetical protein
MGSAKWHRVQTLVDADFGVQRGTVATSLDDLINGGGGHHDAPRHSSLLARDHDPNELAWLLFVHHGRHRRHLASSAEAVRQRDVMLHSSQRVELSLAP